MKVKKGMKVKRKKHPFQYSLVWMHIKRCTSYIWNEIKKQDGVYGPLHNYIIQKEVQKETVGVHLLGRRHRKYALSLFT